MPVAHFHVFVVGDDAVPTLPRLTVAKFGTAMDVQRGDALASARVIRPDEPSSMLLHRWHDRRAKDRRARAIRQRGRQRANG